MKKDKMLEGRIVKDPESEKEAKKQKKKKRGFNVEIMRITIIFFAMFISLGVFLTVFNVFRAEDVINNPYNKRQETFSEKVIRGNIYASDNSVLAYTQVNEDGSETRVYPYGSLFAHVVGYDTNGKLGIELNYNFNLLTSHDNLFTRIVNDFTGEKDLGDNVYTTLDVGLQEVAYDAMGDREGGVIAMDPSTGRILAMVSKPDFDPNTVAYEWADLIEEDEETGEESGVLVNRVTQGLYTPGSTFKFFTLFEYIRENPNYADYAYECIGYIGEGEEELECFDGTVHGYEDLTDSFANSCNASFANIGLSLNLKSFNELANKLYFNKQLPGNFAHNDSKFSLAEDASTFEIMQTSIGQGKTLVSPLHMALIMSAFSNGGDLMMPYLVDYTTNVSGDVVKEYKPSKYATLFTESEINILKDYLRAVVEYGTATKLNSDIYTAYGKTGTAETTTDRGDNLWFVGYAESGDKKLVVCAVTEDVTDSYNYSLDVTKALFDYYFQ